MADSDVNVTNADQVTIPLDPAGNIHPAIIWIVSFVTVGVLVAFALLTYLILTSDRGLDPATKGGIIQTWNNLAVAAAAVWTSSSVIGKLKGQK